MLISLHLPKTAGVSFRKSLEEHYGESLIEDYGDSPINTSVYERNRRAIEQSLINSERAFDSIECIHGHFLPLKYLLFSVKHPTMFVTWMRNPVERVLSHYYYWRRTYNPESSAPLQRKMVEEEWSLERFCLGPEVKNLYAQFLWGFPLSYFSFIGITEFYQQDLAYFSQKMLGTDLNEKIENINEEKGKGYDIDRSLKKDLEKHHDIDLLIYNRAIEKRSQGISGNHNR